MYEEDDYYYFGDFMETASCTFEHDCSLYWYTDFTEPLMLSCHEME